MGKDKGDKILDTLFALGPMKSCDLFSYDVWVGSLWPKVDPKAIFVWRPVVALSLQITKVAWLLGYVGYKSIIGDNLATGYHHH